MTMLLHFERERERGREGGREGEGGRGRGRESTIFTAFVDYLRPNSTRAPKSLTAPQTSLRAVFKLMFEITIFSNITLTGTIFFFPAYT